MPKAIYRGGSKDNTVAEYNQLPTHIFFTDDKKDIFEHYALSFNQREYNLLKSGNLKNFEESYANKHWLK